MKGGADGAVINFKLEQVNLGRVDQDGDTLYSCVISETGAPKPSVDKGLGPNQRALLAELDAFFDMTEVGLDLEAWVKATHQVLDCKVPKKTLRDAARKLILDGVVIERSGGYRRA